MIFGLLIIGLCLIASALKNTEHELGAQLQDDMLGADGFIAWAGAIMVIGAIGYVPVLRTPSRYLLALLATVLIVRNGGVFQSAENALTAASAAGPAPSIPTQPVNLLGGGSSGSSSSSSSSSNLSTVASLATLAAMA